MNKKYELTSESIDFLGGKLFRIKALIDFGIVTKGELGGYIKKGENLSQDGDAWVYGEAKVYGNAWVAGNAGVSDNAGVSGNARVSDNAWVSDNARVADNAGVSGNARVSDNARVSGNAGVSDNAGVSGNARVSDNAWVSDNARVADNAGVSGNARVAGNAWVAGNAGVAGNARVSGNAGVKTSTDYFMVSPIGSRSSSITFTKSNMSVTTGCWHGTIEEFILAAKKTHGNNQHAKNYLALVKFVKAMWREEK